MALLTDIRQLFRRVRPNRRMVSGNATTGPGVKNQLSFMTFVIGAVIFTLFVALISALIAYFQFVKDANIEYKNAVTEFNNTIKQYNDDKIKMLEDRVTKLEGPTTPSPAVKK